VTMARRARHHRHLLVDGHNLIHHDAGLRRFVDADMGRAHRVLERRLHGRKRVHLFYDGGPDGARRTHRGGLDIHYTGGGSADDAIVAWLQAHPGLPATVVTDDRELAGRCRAHGARVQATASLAGDGPSAAAADGSEPDRGPPPPDEVDGWLEAFGGEPED